MRRFRAYLLLGVLFALGLLAFVAHSPSRSIQYRTLMVKQDEPPAIETTYKNSTTVSGTDGLLLNKTEKEHTTVWPTQLSPIKEQIDVVYTWVNGSDPEFLKAMNREVTAMGGKPVDTRGQRFYDAGVMRYSMRSLVMFAPWIGNIYVVTNGQVPCWLNTSNPRVKVIFHSQIFTNKSHLPTFNSPAIEVHLHRISGLSEKFLYMNDDFLLGAKVTFDDFYTANKGYKVYFGAKVLPLNKKVDKMEQIYFDSIRHVKQLFKTFFDFDVTYYTEHVPYMINRSIMQRLQDKLQPYFNASSSHKFRHSDDIQIPAAYFNFLRSEKIPSEIVPYKYSTVVYAWFDNDVAKNAKRYEGPKNTKFYCINDKVDYSKRESSMKAVDGLVAFLKKRYPSKSEFENEKMTC